MNTTNKNITFKGKELTILGKELHVGDRAPSVKLTANDMSDLATDSFKGKTLVISVVPSLDTPVCAIQTKRFNQECGASGKNVEVLTVSMDLPFAQKRWCGAEGVTNVTTASDYKYRNFGEAFGVLIKEWGLLTRAVFVVSPNGEIRHVEYVKEVSSEPDYTAVMESLKKIPT